MRVPCQPSQVSPSLTTLPQAGTAAAWRLLKRHAPPLYLRLARARGADFHAVTPQTDLVIAGVPGSANSFLRSAILIDNPDLRISSHAHVWTEVRDGVRWGRPVVLLVREPLGAAASRIARFGGISPAEALSEYAEYHRRVLPWADDVVVSRFEDATARPGEVVERLNERYGLALRPFRHDDEATLGELHALLQQANGAVPSGHVESEERRRTLAQVHAALRGPELRELRARCLGLHAELTGAWRRD